MDLWFLYNGSLRTSVTGLWGFPPDLAMPVAFLMSTNGDLHLALDRVAHSFAFENKNTDIIFKTPLKPSSSIQPKMFACTQTNIIYHSLHWTADTSMDISLDEDWEVLNDKCSMAVFIVLPNTDVWWIDCRLVCKQQKSPCKCFVTNSEARETAFGSLTNEKSLCFLKLSNFDNYLYLIVF